MEREYGPLGSNTGLVLMSGQPCCCHCNDARPDEYEITLAGFVAHWLYCDCTALNDTWTVSYVGKIHTDVGCYCRWTYTINPAICDFDTIDLLISARGTGFPSTRSVIVYEAATADPRNPGSGNHYMWSEAHDWTCQLAGEAISSSSFTPNICMGALDPFPTCSVTAV